MSNSKIFLGRVSTIYALMFFFAVVLLQFKLFYVSGFPLTVVPFVTLVIVLMSLEFSRASIKLVLIFSLVLLYVFLNAFIFSSAINHELNFTYLLFLYCVFVWISVTAFSVKNNILSLGMVRYVVLVIWLYSFLQFLFSNAYENMIFHKLMEPFSYYDELIRPDIIDGVVTRSFGFYLEPSYLALVVFFLVNLMFILSEERKIFYFLLLSVLFMALSATGIIVVILQGALLFLVSSCSPLKRVIFVLPFILVCFFSIPILVPRVGEILIPGTSGYYRYVVPFEVAKVSLLEYPFGIPMGTISEYVESFGFMNGGKIGTSIDNGVFSYVIYFGWPALILIAGIVFVMVQKFLSGKLSSAHMFSVLSFFLFSLFFNGGIFSVEFVFLVAMLVLVFRMRWRSDKHCDCRI